ncbi:MAG: hypothetical protein HKM96_12360, partial [Boseongicola sp.]|nr:hypothetical protein [Boseongicola sp.]
MTSASEINLSRYLEKGDTVVAVAPDAACIDALGKVDDITVLIAEPAPGNDAGEVVFPDPSGPFTGTLDRSADDIPRHIRLLHIGRNASAYDILRGATNMLRRARIDLVHVSGDEGLRHRSAIVAFLACVGYQSIPSADHEDAPTESTEVTEESIFAVHERLLPGMSGTWPESAEDRLSRY